jgi:hypothetical protein
MKNETNFNIETPVEEFHELTKEIKKQNIKKRIPSMDIGELHQEKNCQKLIIISNNINTFTGIIKTLRARATKQKNKLEFIRIWTSGLKEKTILFPYEEQLSIDPPEIITSSLKQCINSLPEIINNWKKLHHIIFP